jgi:hypothetical protein
MIIIRLTYYSRNRVDRLGGTMHDRVHDPQLMRPDRLGDLIEAVVGRAPPDQGETAWTSGSVTNAA